MEDEFSDSQISAKTCNMIRWKSGKRVDPRLLSLLEAFGEIYMNRHEFFKKIFRGNHEELFTKISDALKKKRQAKKARSMPRSMSMRGVDDDESDELSLERLKVKRTYMTVAGPDDELRKQNVILAGADDELALNYRFKVRRPKVLVADPDGTGPTDQGDQTETTQGSKDSK